MFMASAFSGVVYGYLVQYFRGLVSRATELSSPDTEVQSVVAEANRCSGKVFASDPTTHKIAGKFTPKNSRSPATGAATRSFSTADILASTEKNGRQS